MRGRSSVSDAELHAYVDGQLSPARAQEVTAWLGEHPDDESRVAGWRSQNEAIRRAYPAPTRERLAATFRPAPPALPAAAEAPASAASIAAYRARRRRNQVVATALAFAAGAMVAGAAALAIQQLGARARRPVAIQVESIPAGRDAQSLAIEAWRTFAEDRRRPVEITDRDHAALVVWLAERTGLQATPQAAGVRLLGGRVIPGFADPAAFLLYETGDSERLALVAERSVAGPDSGFSRGRADLRAVGWRANGFDYALAGRLPQERLKAIADGFGASLKP